MLNDPRREDGGGREVEDYPFPDHCTNLHTSLANTTEVPSVSANVCFTRSQEWQHQINQRDFQYLTDLINACNKSLYVSSVLSSTTTILTWEHPFLLSFKSRHQSQPKKENLAALAACRGVSTQVLPHESVPPRFCSLFQSPHHKPDIDKFFESVIKVSLKVHPK